MKKKLTILFCIMLLVTVVSTTITILAKQDENKEEKLTIVTSFYPMYTLVQNLVNGLDVEVVNLTDYQSGCLHDYQLTTSDMKKLEEADIFVMNGGGMETFIEGILEVYPNLPMINASEGIEYLIGEEHDHHHDEGAENEAEHEAEHEAESLEYNAHVWLNMNYYLQEIQNVQTALAKYDAGNALIYQENSLAYQNKIKELKNEVETSLADTDNTKIVIFHDAFAYLAQELGLEVIHTVNMDGEASLSAGEVAEVINEINLHQVKVMFTEAQYATSIPESIVKETDSSVYVIDTIVNGDGSKDSYITAMKNNLKVLKEALDRK